MAEIEDLVAELKKSVKSITPALHKIATAWAIAKGTLPIIGVTKVKQVEDAATATQITLSLEEVRRLEKLGDKTGVQTLREWEKEMSELGAGRNN